MKVISSDVSSTEHGRPDRPPAVELFYHRRQTFKRSKFKTGP